MKDTSEPAFPITGWREHDGDNKGMTLRDYFAIKVLPDLLGIAIPLSGITMAIQTCPSDAYKIADAMLAERDKE